MKKLILALCAILVLSCFTAVAEEAFKVTLWEHTSKDLDEAGNVIEVPVKVTLTGSTRSKRMSTTASLRRSAATA